MQGIDATSDGLQDDRPCQHQLLIHQALGQRGVLQPREAVVHALEVRVLELQLAREPFAPVEVDLDVEGEPRLDANVHETERLVLPVLVEVQALSRARLESTFFGLGRTVVLEALARFHGAQHADEPGLLQRMLGKKLSRHVLLAELGRLQVAPRATKVVGHAEHRVLDARAGLEGEVLEVQQPHPGARQHHVHAAVGHQRLQNAAKHEAIKA